MNKDVAPAISTTTPNQSRVSHVEALRALGIDPYPVAGFHPTCTASDAILDRDRLVETRSVIRIAGRITNMRRVGKIVFLDLLDSGSRLQLYISAGEEAKSAQDLQQYLDIGDFVGAQGVMFITKRGELSLFVECLEILCKPVNQIPIGKRTADGDVHHALADTGRLYRERHIALLTDPSLRKCLVQRDHILRAIRAYFYEANFLEVETPVLGRFYGGAAARPFITRAEALDTDLYLRVSPEGALKRLLCGGIERVFEIGKNFRNEGVDHSHNPEFTAIEWYEAWTDYYDQMIRFETLVAKLATVVTGSTIVHFRGRPLDFTPPWPRLRVVEAVAEALGVPVEGVTHDLLLRHWRQYHQSYCKDVNWGEALMGVFEKMVEPNLWGPVFIIDHPVEISPLTKQHRKDKRFVERFEPFAGGMEIGNAYSELNDPIEQRRRLVEQDMERDEKYGLDEPFLQAIDDGMPQAGGAGMGIDRIVMMLTDNSRLANVIIFPMV